MKYFTKAQIEEIRKALATLGVRDTDLPDVVGLDGSELVAIVQDGENRKVSIRKMIHDYLPDDIASGVDGADGRSAYQVWLDAGNTGSVADFLLSLKGKDGKDGRDGTDGTPGTPGARGADGQGVPAGGSAGQVLAKKSGSNYDTEWINPPTSSDTPITEIPRATSTVLGGIRVGLPEQSGRNFGVKLDGDARAYVTVPASGSDTPGESGGYYEQVFRAYAHGSTVTSADLVGVDVIDDDNGQWKHYIDDTAASALGDYDVWMAIRWVAGNGTPGVWRGPWNISGPAGEAGADGTDIEFVYKRTANEEDTPNPIRKTDTQATASRNAQRQSTEAPSGGVSYNKADWYPDGWTDNPQGVTSTLRIEWMCMRFKTGGAGGQGGTWSDFTAPVVWSAYGRQGIDGDGIEYIYAVSDTVPTDPNDPSKWFDHTGYQTTREYREGSLWADNPINLANLPSGSTQWVSVRKKYADTTSHPTYGTNPYWHSYTAPAFWNYKARDGVSSAAVVSLEPDMLYVPCDSDGHITAAFTGTTNVKVQYAGAEVSNITIGSITVTDTSSTPNTYTGVTSVNGKTITVSLPSTFTANFSSAQLFVRIPISCTINSTPLDLEAVLIIVGHSIGTNGTSYSLKTSAGIVKIHDGNYSTSAIDVSCIVNDGTTGFAEYTPVGTSSLPALSELGPGFSIRYFVGTDTEHMTNMVTQNINSIPTTGIDSSVTIQLLYNSMVIVQEYIPFVVEPLVPETQQILKSIVFMRAATEPAKPGDNVGSFSEPVPTSLGWSDGLPAYVDGTRIWMTTRVFTSDGQSPQQSSWTAVQPATDNDNVDIEFAYMQTNDGVPATPVGGASGSPVDSNRHLTDYPYGHTNQVWFDPDLDKYDGQNHLRDFQHMYWMAIREKHNSTNTTWTIIRIKGERGETGIKGEDAIPVRIRNWADLYQQTHTENNGTVTLTPLTGDNRIFSGYEEWTEVVNGETVTKKAPFRDVIIITPQDYPDAEAFPTSGLPCPAETQEHVVTPALYVVNYRIPSSAGQCTAYTSVGYPDVDPNVVPAEDLIIPHNAISGTGASTKNYTVTLYQNAAASADAISSYHFYWSVFTNLGAIYAQLLVATQAYIGSLTVNHLTTSNGNNSSIDIQNGLITFRDSNGVIRIVMGQDTNDTTPVLWFYNEDGTPAYNLGPTGFVRNGIIDPPKWNNLLFYYSSTPFSTTGAGTNLRTLTPISVYQYEDAFKIYFNADASQGYRVPLSPFNINTELVHYSDMNGKYFRQYFIPTSRNYSSYFANDGYYIICGGWGTPVIDGNTATYQNYDTGHSWEDIMAFSVQDGHIQNKYECKIVETVLEDTVTLNVKRFSMMITPD